MNDDLTFGFTLTIVGMAGTLLSLWLLSLLISALKKVFPLPSENPAPGTEK
jgi:Na+-transporting methylmalonyl-CoA/oxaloacetate decarboxylase gamma subunit